MTSTPRDLFIPVDENTSSGAGDSASTRTAVVDSFLPCPPALSSRLPPLHPVHAAVLAPPAERLAPKVEGDAEEAEEQDQARVCHDWRDESVISISLSVYLQFSRILQERTYPTCSVHGVMNLLNP